MKTLTTTLAIVIAGSSFAGFSLEAADDKKPDSPRGGGSFFKKMDTNGDKAVSKEEAGDRWERIGRLDKDEDNQVTLKEMMAARKDGDRPRPGGPDRPGDRPSPGAMFERADKNKDGKITKDEVPERAWEFIGKMDKDGDDAVTEEEAKAGRPNRPGAGKPGEDGPGRGAEMLKRADKNGDGNISKDEVPEQAWERLGRLDKDGDDVVTKQEMAAGMMARRGDKGGPGAGRPEGGPGAMFQRYDKDEDGKIAESEVPGEMWNKLRRADTDADGLVSKEELGKVYGARDGARKDKEKKEKKDSV